ncbi:TonB-dependent receptor [Acidicapsa acidisoli]|uniref:TonB-dependent receptor n=1 Tax=Acidicapsa acidisoli TaxID=1615681 RepID=UPI0021DF427A|nr:TonB-dependent receptor [Acidicapsa acidisoli]
MKGSFAGRMGGFPLLATGVIFALICTIDCGQTFSQEAIPSGTTGTVHTSTGAAVAGATIEIKLSNNRLTAGTATDGSFHFSQIPPGSYSLNLTLNKRRYAYSGAITFPLNSSTLAITLPAPNASSASLAVAFVPLETEKGDQPATSGGEELSSHAVSSLPLNKRDFSQLLLLAAGTMTDANGATNFTQQFAINGQRGVEAVFAMDGSDTSDPEMGGATFTNFNVDAVEEIQSSSGWMAAEVGRGAAGFTNIITRSGRSGFHGSVFEFVRNSAFDARNFFDHATPATPGRIPPFRRNEFGFTNGGPVVLPHIYNGAGKTFYFGQYQGFRQVLGTTQVFPVPTADQRPSAANNGVVSDPVKFQQPDGSYVTDTLYVPVNSLISPILARYPLPNLATGAYGVNTYAASSKVVTNANQFSFRIDHAIAAKDQFFARVNFDDLTGPTTNPDQTAIDPSFGVTYIDHQRNVVGTWTHTASPRLVLESLIGITRSTPGFPTPNLVDPAVKFNDGTFEAFNSAGGSVMQAYGNLFHGREMVTWTRNGHVLKAGVEARLNRDTTYFGISPNGEYDFGGGSAYATEAILSQSGTHDVAPGALLPDTVSGFLSGSPAAYTVAIASNQFSDGAHIGPAAINRNSYSAFAQDTWKVTSRFTLDYGLRWEIYTPITERAKRTSGFLRVDGKQEFVVNPQPGYKTDWNGWGPRVQATWQISRDFQAHAGGAITIIPPNIWQDNFLTGSTPFAVYPRLVAAQGAPVAYGFRITPSQLPVAVTPAGQPIFAAGNSKRVPANTVMDVDRYEKEIASLSASGVVSDLNLSGVDRSFSNARLYTWSTGIEKRIGGLTADANYVGTASNHLPRTSFPNAYPYASPGFAPDTTFNSSGSVTGGLGVENLITATAHSTYHALQTSLSGTVPHGGPGIQASYTWGKSIDDTSQVIGGTGSTGAVAQGFPQNPTDTHPEKGPSAFDVTHGFALSLAQDLHGEEVGFLQSIPRKVTGGWELLSISSIASGSPFTVFSGEQQTGYGSNGVDRPDQIGKPNLSTARQNRADYFGLGLDNSSYFYIPTNIPGGSGPNQGRFGALGRNTFRGPAYYDFDFALIKDTAFGQRKSGMELVDLQFRSEFFNLFNIVNMGLPANIITGSGFGEISKTAGTSRQIQFSLKLIY